MLATIRQSILTSIQALLANKGRSFLTMLGIIIGVGAVIVIMAVGAGAQSLIVSQVKSMGTDLVGVLPGKADDDGPPASVMGIVITTLTYSDVVALNKKSNVPNLIAAVGFTKGVGTAAWGSQTYDTNLSGTTHNYVEVEGGEIASGRFISAEEERSMSRVAVLGSTVAKELFHDSYPVGQKIKIDKHMFEVVGVMKERGTVMMQDYDDQIFIPLKTMQKIIAGVNHLGLIRAKVDNEDNIGRALEDIAVTLREQHDIDDSSGASDDFTVRSAAEALDVITTITDALKYFLAAMASLALLVGGIGIMNIMLVAVSERTREIGLRKAVGANNANIMNQFLLEAISVTLVGGIIGVIGGTVLSYLIAVVARYLEYDWAFIVSLSSVFLSISVSAAVGLVFGLYPARQASKLQPVEALRYE